VKITIIHTESPSTTRVTPNTEPAVFATRVAH
jgi:hypothetical protein